MKINLKDVEIIYINLPNYVNRNKSMINMLEHYGLKYKRVDGIVSGNQDYDIIADAHRKALDFSSAEQVLILEDDCIPHIYREEFDVPDNADIVYLGLHGYEHGKEKVSKEVWKIFKMIGAHAILYLTQQGKDILKEAQQLTKDKKYGFDDSLAELQHKVNTYALNSPIWYQKNYPELTKFNLGEVENVTFGHYGGGCSDYEEPIVFS